MTNERVMPVATAVAAAVLAVGTPVRLPAIQEPAREQPRVTVRLNKVKDFRGRQVTACGRVITHDCDVKRRITRLDLDRAYWWNPVAVMIGDEARRRFPPRLEDLYTGADICATGIVERHNRRDVIRVDGPDQIVIKKPPPPAPFGADSVRPCDPGVEMPVVKREVKPSYTMEAMRAKEQGKVFLEALILPDGSVRDTRVLVGFPLENGLNQSAVAAVRQWQFEAGRASGKPAPVVVTIELQFTLK